MGRWVWQNDDGSIEVPSGDLANHLTQSVNAYKQQQQPSQAKVSNTGAYVQNPGTTQENMQQLYYQMNPQQQQPRSVAYWNPNTNVVYAGGMPSQQPQVVGVGYGYQPGFQTAPVVYDMATGQYVGGSMNAFGPTGNATVPMTQPSTTNNISATTTTTTTTKSQDNTNNISDSNSDSDKALRERDYADAINLASLETDSYDAAKQYNPQYDNNPSPIIQQVADRFVPTLEDFNRVGRWGNITDYNIFLEEWKRMPEEERTSFWSYLDRW